MPKAIDPGDEKFRAMLTVGSPLHVSLKVWRGEMLAQIRSRSTRDWHQMISDCLLLCKSFKNNMVRSFIQSSETDTCCSVSQPEMFY